MRTGVLAVGVNTAQHLFHRPGAEPWRRPPHGLDDLDTALLRKCRWTPESGPGWPPPLRCGSRTGVHTRHSLGGGFAMIAQRATRAGYIVRLYGCACSVVDRHRLYRRTQFGDVLLRCRSPLVVSKATSGLGVRAARDDTVCPSGPSRSTTALSAALSAEPRAYCRPRDREPHRVSPVAAPSTG